MHLVGYIVRKTQKKITSTYIVRDEATTQSNRVIFCAREQILSKTARSSAGFVSRSLVCYTSTEPNDIIVPVCRKYLLENISVFIIL